MNCSPPVAASAKAGWSTRRVVYTAALALHAAMAGGYEAEEIEDAAARMQYAYYTGDARSLESVLAETASLETDQKLAGAKSYHLAYGYWRLAELQAEAAAAASAPNARASSSRAAQACAEHARHAIAADGRNADAYAIQAVCSVVRSTGMRAPRNDRSDTRGSCRGGPLRTARALEPDNPRVQLIAQLCADDPQGPEELRKVVEAFESAPPSTGRTPEWGHAEALALLGQSYLTSGDPVAARDALERALVIAPDYRKAQELLQTAAARPR